MQNVNRRSKNSNFFMASDRDTFFDLESKNSSVSLVFGRALASSILATMKEPAIGKIKLQPITRRRILAPKLVVLAVVNPKRKRRIR